MNALSKVEFYSFHMAEPCFTLLHPVTSSVEPLPVLWVLPQTWLRTPDMSPSLLSLPAHNLMLLSPLSLSSPSRLSFP